MKKVEDEKLLFLLHLVLIHFFVLVCPPQPFWEADLCGLQHLSVPYTLGLVQDLSITWQEGREYLPLLFLPFGLCLSCPVSLLPALTSTKLDLIDHCKLYTKLGSYI